MSVHSTPRPYFTPGKDPVPIVQEAECAPGPVWTGGKSQLTGIRSPDRPARSYSLYRLSHPAHPYRYIVCKNKSKHTFMTLWIKHGLYSRKCLFNSHWNTSCRDNVCFNVAVLSAVAVFALFVQYQLHCLTYAEVCQMIYIADRRFYSQLHV